MPSEVTDAVAMARKALIAELRHAPQGTRQLGHRAANVIEALEDSLTAALAVREGVEDRIEIGWAYQDKRWDKDHWHLCTDRPRSFEGREVRPVFIASPALDGGRE